MPCKRARLDSYVVVVGRKPQRQWTKEERSGCRTLSCCLLVLFVVIFITIVPWYVVSHCYRAPGGELNNVKIRNILVFSNLDRSSQWLVSSLIDVALTTKNKNDLAKCFTTFRRMEVSVKYKGFMILRSEIPLGFPLKPGRSRKVLAELEGKTFQLTNSQVGQELQSDLWGDTINLEYGIGTQYLISDRRPYWSHMYCWWESKTLLMSS